MGQRQDETEVPLTSNVAGVRVIDDSVVIKLRQLPAQAASTFAKTIVHDDDLNVGVCLADATLHTRQDQRLVLEGRDEDGDAA